MPCTWLRYITRRKPWPSYSSVRSGSDTALLFIRLQVLSILTLVEFRIRILCLWASRIRNLFVRIRSGSFHQPRVRIRTKRSRIRNTGRMIRKIIGRSVGRFHEREGHCTGTSTVYWFRYSGFLFLKIWIKEFILRLLP